MSASGIKGRRWARRSRRRALVAIAIGVVLVGAVAVYYGAVMLIARVPTRVVIDMENRVTIDSRAAERGEVWKGRLPTHVPLYSKFWDGTEVPGYYYHDLATGLYGVRTNLMPGKVRHVHGRGCELVWSEISYDISHPSYFADPTELRGSITDRVEIDYFPRFK